tara:strand:- start:15863 stop:16270 length:408 start_codon:yes stop_codon:yes gene_type:complete
MGVRRKSRELALQILFQENFNPDINMEQSLALYRESFDTSPEVWEYTKILVRGVRDHIAEIDQCIQAYSPNWKLQRMAVVDKSLLRIACFEIKFLDRDVPPKVVINEAIEIGRKYSSEDSPSFLNAILDNIAKNR